MDAASTTRPAQTRPISETQELDDDDRGAARPADGAGSFVAVDISADSDGHPTWKQPVRTYFRRDGDGWKLVGLERMPEGPEAPAKK